MKGGRRDPFQSTNRTKERTGQSGWCSRMFVYTSVKESRLSADASSLRSTMILTLFSIFCQKRRPYEHPSKNPCSNRHIVIETTSLEAAPGASRHRCVMATASVYADASHKRAYRGPLHPRALLNNKARRTWASWFTHPRLNPVH